MALSAQCSHLRIVKDLLISDVCSHLSEGSSPFRQEGSLPERSDLLLCARKDLLLSDLLLYDPKDLLLNARKDLLLYDPKDLLITAHCLLRRSVISAHCLLIDEAVFQVHVRVFEHARHATCFGVPR